MTAYHCGVRESNASSIVVYWNFHSPDCGDAGGGSLADAQSGSTLLASRSRSDFTLIQLDVPPDPEWQVSYAGWDHSDVDANSAVGIHHPGLDEKAISFDYDPIQTTTYFSTSSPGDGSHVMVSDWDLGTTEGGSSGSALFNQDHRVIGQLHGGYAACSNDQQDWYGRFAASWDDGADASSRLSDWLDMSGTGVETLDTLAPWAKGMWVTPSSDTVFQGRTGGPFEPFSVVYTLENLGETDLAFEVRLSQTWLAPDTTSGTLAPEETVEITLSLQASAGDLSNGAYSDSVQFLNLSDGEGDTSRDITLQVGTPVVQFQWDLDTDPGWTTEDSWAWGDPLGLGGSRGDPDPSSGYTGDNVYGYNLSGDYTSHLPQKHLTTEAIDCSDLTGVSVGFWRWLGVEESSCDQATLSVSNDGANWTTVWGNLDSLNGAPWTWVEYDLSETADQQATVYLRWTMGPTDSSANYCGWNIDDIEILGVSPGVDAPRDTGEDSGETVDSGPDDTEPQDSGEGPTGVTGDGEDTKACGCQGTGGSPPTPWWWASLLAALVAVRRKSPQVFSR